MTRIIRTAGCALALVFLSLSVFTAATAQSWPQKYGYCHGLAGNPRVNNYTRMFVLGPSSPPDAMSGFIRLLHQKYGGYVTQEIACRTFATAAEAETQYRQMLDEAAQYSATWPPVEIDWIPEGGSPLSGAAAAPAPAPANAATPGANAAVTPKPAPPAVATKPASPAPAKPATAASKPAVYVICRSDRNTDLRRFYNPPVDGRGAGYPEWQDSWHKYLVDNYGFKGSNFGCGKYPTKEAAQTDYDYWVATARATPSINGQPSPVIITNWKY